MIFFFIDIGLPVASYLGLAIAVVGFLLAFLFKNFIGRIETRLEENEKNIETNRKGIEEERRERDKDMRSMDNKINGLEVKVLTILHEIKDRFNDLRK